MNEKKTILLVLFVVIRLLCIETSFADKAYVCEQLKKIPEKEREALTLFFETLLAEDFAYTLFGDKPMSEATYPIAGDGYRKYSWLATGEKIWNRYCALFPASKFVFKFQPAGDSHRVLLINKNAFLHTVQQHLQLFQSILGSDVTPEKVLEKFTQENKRSFGEVLNDHSGLFGLLFGYGYSNSQYFQKQSDLNDEILRWCHPPICFFKEEVLELCNPDQKIAEQVPQELKALLDQRTSRKPSEFIHCEENEFCATNNLSLFSLPSFAIDPDNRSEAVALLENYEKTRHALLAAYNGKDFLEVTLCKLIEK